MFLVPKHKNGGSSIEIIYDRKALVFTKKSCYAKKEKKKRKRKKKIPSSL